MLIAVLCCLTVCIPYSAFSACAGCTLQALQVAAHLQLAALEGESLPPLVLPVEVEHWVEKQLAAAGTAAPPALPFAMRAAAQGQQQQQPRSGAPSVPKKRKWQAGSPTSTVDAVAPAAAAPARSWAAVVAGRPAAATAALQQPAVSAISKLPFWQQLKEQLAAEQHRELGLQEHAVLAVTNMLSPSGQHLSSRGCGVHDAVAGSSLAAAGAAAPGAAATEPSNGRPSLLQQLQQEAMAERAATERLVRIQAT